MNSDIYDLHLLMFGGPSSSNQREPTSITPSSSGDAGGPSTTTKDASGIDNAADAHDHRQADQELKQASSAAGVDDQATQGILVEMALTFARLLSDGPEDGTQDGGWSGLKGKASRCT